MSAGNIRGLPPVTAGGSIAAILTVCTLWMLLSDVKSDTTCEECRPGNSKEMQRGNETCQAKVPTFGSRALILLRQSSLMRMVNMIVSDQGQLISLPDLATALGCSEDTHLLRCLSQPL